MFIDNTIDYTVLSYRFRNFINLTKVDKLMILRERNHPDVKRWMVTNEDIKEEDHLNFIDSLTKRTDAYYWLIEREGLPIGVLSIIHCNYDKSEGETGYYLFHSQQDTGVGLEFQYIYKKFFFEVLGIENLPGHILYGNTSAYQLTAFFGGVEDGETLINGQKYLIMHTPKENFQKVNPNKLTSQFVKFIKRNKKIWE